jgi:hypothetical protein
MAGHYRQLGGRCCSAHLAAAIKQGSFRPLEMRGAVVICSYQFARAKTADVSAGLWGLVGIDEAHRL